MCMWKTVRWMCIFAAYVKPCLHLASKNTFKRYAARAIAFPRNCRRKNNDPHFFSATRAISSRFVVAASGRSLVVLGHTVASGNSTGGLRAVQHFATHSHESLAVELSHCLVAARSEGQLGYHVRSSLQTIT